MDKEEIIEKMSEDELIEHQNILEKWAKELNIPIEEVPWGVGLIKFKSEKSDLTKKEIEYGESLNKMAKEWLKEKLDIEVREI